MPSGPSGTIKLPFEKLNSILTNGIAREVCIAENFGRGCFPSVLSKFGRYLVARILQTQRAMIQDQAPVRNVDFKHSFAWTILTINLMAQLSSQAYLPSEIGTILRLPNLIKLWKIRCHRCNMDGRTIPGWTGNPNAALTLR
jgi:hypothetical protein